jgi:hypothetical protein
VHVLAPQLASFIICEHAPGICNAIADIHGGIVMKEQRPSAPVLARVALAVAVAAWMPMAACAAQSGTKPEVT